jgi:hypothetical protein
MNDALRRWRWLLIGLGFFAAAAAVHGYFHTVVDSRTRPAPWLSQVPWSLAGLGLAGLLGSAFIAVRRATSLKNRAGTGALHGGLGLLCLWGVLASDPNFPLGPTHLASMELPENQGMAHLYKESVFCEQTAWRASKGSIWVHPDEAVPAGTCDQAGFLSWDEEEEKVVLVDSEGDPLPPAEPVSLGGWGPH